MLPCDKPESQLDSIPEAKPVVNRAEIIFDDVLSRPQKACDFYIFVAGRYALNDD